MSSVRHKTIEHEIFGGPLCVILLALDNTISERAKRKIFVENIQRRAISSQTRDFTGVPVDLEALHSCIYTIAWRLPSVSLHNHPFIGLLSSPCPVFIPRYGAAVTRSAAATLSVQGAGIRSTRPNSGPDAPR